jgi:hypothetical protein
MKKAEDLASVRAGEPARVADDVSNQVAFLLAKRPVEGWKYLEVLGAGQQSPVL